MPDERDETQPEEALMEALRAAARRHDPVPDFVVSSGRAAWSWRSIDAELAELAYDSLTDADQLALVRGAAGPRLVSFEAGDVSIEIEVHEQGDERHLVGQLVPPQAATLTVRHPDTSHDLTTDDLGRFQSVTRAGPTSLRVLIDQERPVETEWLVL